jgi:hypothetical protein
MPREGMSVWVIARKHGVGRRNGGEGVGSAWPEPRKPLSAAGAELDPFTPVVDEIRIARMFAMSATWQRWRIRR